MCKIPWSSLPAPASWRGPVADGTPFHVRWWQMAAPPLSLASPVKKKYHNLTLKIHYKISKIVLNLLIWYSRYFWLSIYIEQMGVRSANWSRLLRFKQVFLLQHCHYDLMDVAIRRWKLISACFMFSYTRSLKVFYSMNRVIKVVHKFKLSTS